MMQTRVDAERLRSELEQLASFSEAVPPGVTRIVFSEVDLQARAWLKERCQAAGLEVRADAVGNTFARWTCGGAGSAIGMGSHIDAIPNAGRYDGTVGVLGGLEAIRSLKESGFMPKRPIELLIFTAEEPTRFGIGCLGSRLLSGVLAEEQARELKDRNGASLDEIRQTAGFLGPISNVRLSAGYYAAFLELHIEQGPLLEQTGVEIGLVKSIAAPASMSIVLEGEGGHAGAVLMPQRRDALTGGAEIILGIENLALTSGAVDSVATTGICDVFPGAVNSIPSRVRLGIDVRDTDAMRRDSLVRHIKEAAQAVARKRKLGIEITVLNADEPAQCDPRLIEVLGESCEEVGATYREMVSRAYHDSLFMSHIAPVAMIFIPCRGGVSHRPDEFASETDIANGVRVLTQALAKLAS